MAIPSSIAVPNWYSAILVGYSNGMRFIHIKSIYILNATKASIFNTKIISDYHTKIEVNQRSFKNLESFLIRLVTHTAQCILSTIIIEPIGSTLKVLSSYCFLILTKSFDYW